MTKPLSYKIKIAGGEAGKTSKIMDAYQHVANQGGFLGKLTKYIPGFGGYLEREQRRESDKIQRDYLAGELNEARTKMSGINKELAAAMNFDLIGIMDNNITKVERLTERIRYADRGYAGFFDAVKVNEKELAKIYEFDVSLLENIQAIKEWVEVIETGVEDEEDTGELKKKIKKLNKELSEFDNKLNERERVIMEVK